jgi:hypothetical protein
MLQGKPTKAFTATFNRIARRYDGKTDDASGFDIVTAGMAIQIATTATVADAVQRLLSHRGPAFVAMTNREGVKEAIRAVAGTSIGVMDPQGDVVQPSTR